MYVLVVEDDVKMAALLQRGLTDEGLLADVAETGERALQMASETAYDAVVLDRMLPGMDGVTVCRRLRDTGRLVPIIMLTALGAPGERIAGLDAGADDYLSKPFVFAELLARLRALSRRPPLAESSTLRAGDITLNSATRRVMRGHAEIHLSAREFALLHAFMRRPGQVLSRRDLLAECWGGAEGRSNVVDTYVRHLREKLDRPFGADSLETVRGAGYRLRGDRGSHTG